MALPAIGDFPMSLEVNCCDDNIMICGIPLARRLVPGRLSLWRVLVGINHPIDR